MERILNTIALVLYNYNQLSSFKVLVHILDGNPADMIAIAKQMSFNHILKVNHWCTYYFILLSDKTRKKKKTFDAMEAAAVHQL